MPHWFTWSKFERHYCAFFLYLETILSSLIKQSKTIKQRTGSSAFHSMDHSPADRYSDSLVTESYWCLSFLCIPAFLPCLQIRKHVVHTWNMWGGAGLCAGGCVTHSALAPGSNEKCDLWELCKTHWWLKHSSSHCRFLSVKRYCFGVTICHQSQIQAITCCAVMWPKQVWLQLLASACLFPDTAGWQETTPRPHAPGAGSQQRQLQHAPDQIRCWLSCLPKPLPH